MYDGKNGSLRKANKAKNDEFYTQLSDVAKELMHYKPHFKDKVVFCNCDDPTYSAFWRYFHLNFHELSLKKLITTHYDKTEPTYKMEYDGTYDKDLYSQDIDNDINIGIKTPLQGNGDFRNQECLDLLDECDIVCTNPPFSLFREYVAQLIAHKKHFLIIGNCNAMSYKEIFPLIKDNKIWGGFNSVSNFIQPDGSIKTFGNIMWFTNLEHNKRHEPLILWQHYYDNQGNPLPDVNIRYPKYDNYDAINVDRVANIPCDYYGLMGIPNTFTGAICPEQFEIIDGIGRYSIMTNEETKANKKYLSMIDGKAKYFRTIVKLKNKKEDDQNGGKKE